MTLRALLKKGICATALSLGLAHVATAAYPEKPVTIVVPYSPGGATDATARIMAEALQDITGNTFVVENTPGAGTTIGAGRAARARADGYTLLFGGLSANVLAPQIYKKVASFTPEDFEAVGRVASQPLILVVNENSKYQTLEELIKEAKDKPGMLNFGSPGLGSAPHLVSELFLAEAQIDALHIPFKGAAPALAALIGGEIDFFLDTPTAPMGQVQANRLRALGITAAEPVKGLEGIATMDRQGLSDFEATTWFALYAPKGTDPEILDDLNRWVNKALASPRVEELMATAYLYPAAGSRKDLQDFTDSERSRWLQVIDAEGLEQE